MREQGRGGEVRQEEHFARKRCGAIGGRKIGQEEEGKGVGKERKTAWKKREDEGEMKEDE